MLKWFRKGLSPHQTALAMVGVKNADQVVVVGAADADLPAQLALITGLNGQTLVVDRAEARARVEAAAARAGALVEFAEAPPTALPVAAASADVLVMAFGLGSLGSDARHAAVEEAMRVLRPGGRTIVIEGIRSARAAIPAEQAVEAAEVLARLNGAGGKAVRLLATVNGRTYFEARKSRGPESS
jgi:ubiquinone/menaquinone biosynthesis C-methylase UbiE